MAKENQNVVSPDEAQIEAWKKQYGEVVKLSVARDPEKFEANKMPTNLDEVPNYVCYLKKPDQKLQNFALITMPKNMIAAGKSIVKECWLGGDLEIKENDAYFSAIGIQAIELVDVYQTSLKKL